MNNSNLRDLFLAFGAIAIAITAVLAVSEYSYRQQKQVIAIEVARANNGWGK